MVAASIKALNLYWTMLFTPEDLKHCLFIYIKIAHEHTLSNYNDRTLLSTNTTAKANLNTGLLSCTDILGINNNYY